MVRRRSPADEPVLLVRRWSGKYPAGSVGGWHRVFCRGWRDGANDDQNTVLVVLPSGEPPTRDSLNRLRHEYGLKDDLDDLWAVRPLELVHERGQTMLVLRDPG